MNLINALILSVVEGITEFLPISSTGHLILVSQIIGVPQTEFVKTFEITIQFGAILAVLFLYVRVLYTKRYLIKNLLFAFIPSAIVGLILYKFIKEYLIGNSYITVLSLIIGGILFLVLEYLLKNRTKNTNLEDLTTLQSVSIGIAQSLAVIPGVSRSATTIFGGMLLGLDRKDAIEFSFLLAVPTIAAATMLDIVKTSLAFNQQELLLLFIGCVGSFISALITIQVLLKFIRNNTFVPFGIYRIVVGIIFWWSLLK